MSDLEDDMQPATIHAPPNGQISAQPSYALLRERIIDVIHMSVPRGATMLVVSKGDEELTDVCGRRGWHFPRAANGLYAGCYPADSAEAVEHLRKLQSEGADYLVIPSPAFWWFEHYGGLTRHLQRRHRLIAYHEDVCVVFKLLDSAREPSNGISLPRAPRKR